MNANEHESEMLKVVMSCVVGIGRMIEERFLIMPVRESVHQIADTLRDERLDDLLDYLAELSEPDEPLRAETRAAIEEGLEDIATAA
jgi:hypothetical protein